MYLKYLSAIIAIQNKKIFGRYLDIHFSDPLEVSAQNDRLQHELDTTRTENRNLTKQMQTWKEQLVDIGKGIM